MINDKRFMMMLISWKPVQTLITHHEPMSTSWKSMRLKPPSGGSIGCHGNDSRHRPRQCPSKLGPIRIPSSNPLDMLNLWVPNGSVSGGFHAVLQGSWLGYQHVVVNEVCWEPRPWLLTSHKPWGCTSNLGWLMALKGLPCLMIVLQNYDHH